MHHKVEILVAAALSMCTVAVCLAVDTVAAAVPDIEAERIVAPDNHWQEQIEADRTIAVDNSVAADRSVAVVVADTAAAEHQESPNLTDQLLAVAEA